MNREEPSAKSLPHAGAREMWHSEDPLPVPLVGVQVLLIKAQPVEGVRMIAAPGALARVFPIAWECSPERVVNSI